MPYGPDSDFPVNEIGEQRTVRQRSMDARTLRVLDLVNGSSERQRRQGSWVRGGTSPAAPGEVVEMLAKSPFADLMPQTGEVFMGMQIRGLYDDSSYDFFEVPEEPDKIMWRAAYYGPTNDDGEWSQMVGLVLRYNNSRVNLVEGDEDDPLCDDRDDILLPKIHQVYATCEIGVRISGTAGRGHQQARLYRIDEIETSEGVGLSGMPQLHSEFRADQVDTFLSMIAGLIPDNAEEEPSGEPADMQPDSEEREK